MSDYPGPEYFVDLMNRLLMPKTEVIREATAEMNKLLKSPRSVAALFEVIQKHDDVHIQRLAAVLLRMKIIGHWGRLDESARTHFKDTLITLLKSDGIPQEFRTALADICAVLARVEVPNGEWQEVLDFMFQCTQVESADHRQMGIYLFREMMETIGNLVELQFDSLHELVAKALVDDSMDVRIAAMSAVSPFVDFISDEERMQKFQQLVMPLVDNIRYCLENGQEQHTYDAFEVFHLVVEDNALHLLEPILNDWIAFCFDVAAQETLELESRKQALFFLEQLLRSYPKTFITENILEPCIDLVFKLLCEDDDDEQDSDTSHTAGTAVLDSVCLCLPTKYVYPPLIERTVKFCHSNVAAERKAGITALGILSEGCGEAATKDLDSILDAVLAGIRDSEYSVQISASFSLAELSKHLQPEICAYHERVIPLLFDLLEKDVPEMLALKTLHAYQQFSEHLTPDEVEPYIERALSIFFKRIEGGSLMMHNLILPSISATCLAGKECFEPYVDPVMKMLGDHLFNEDPEMELLRSRALECAGVIAISQGRQTYEPFVEATMNVAAALTGSDDPQVREYVFSFFGHIAQILVEDFVPYLKPCMEEFHKRAMSKEGIVLDSDKEILKGIEREQSDVDISDYSIQVMQSYTDEKVCVLRAMGTLARSTGPAFEPYIDGSLELFEALAENPVLKIENAIRCACMRGCADVIEGVTDVFQRPVTGDWQQGVVQELHPRVTQLLDWFMAFVEKTIRTDEEYQAVLAAMESLAQVVKYVGPAVLHKYSSIFGAELAVLRKEAVALTLRAESFADDDDDDLEFNLYNACSVNLVELFQVGGPMLASYFPGFVDGFMPYFRESLADDYGLVALGTVAEIAFEVGHDAAAPFVPTLIEQAIVGLHHHEPTYRRNACFCIRIMFDICPDETKSLPDWQSAIIPPLQSLFNDEEITVTVENALAAVCSLSRAAPDVLQLEDVVGLVLQCLPLKEDHECAFSIFLWMNSVLSGSLEQVKPNVPHFISLMFSQVCAHEFVIYEKLQDVIFDNLRILKEAGYQQEIFSVAQEGLGDLEEDEQDRMRGVLLRLK